MRITIVGCGSIGIMLARAADEMADVKRIYVMDTQPERAAALASELKKAIMVDDVEEELYHCDLVIEAATQDAARAILPKVVARGVDVMVTSVGVLVDDEFRAAVTEKAKECESKIYIPSGALAGTDALRSAAVAELEDVELVVVKGPKSFAGVRYVIENGIDINALTERTVIFEGNAREAVQFFPKNVNAAATVSLLGIGFDRTKVKVVLDPVSRINSFELRVKGEFGDTVSITNNVPSDQNPKNSTLAGLSAISALKRIVRNEWIGI